MITAGHTWLIKEGSRVSPNTLAPAIPTKRGRQVRVLICGDRNWTDRGPIEAYLASLTPEFTVVVHGGARGADMIGGEVAKQMGMAVEQYSANWKQYGKAAGPIRNCQMLDSQIDLVVWFHDNIESSKGTKNMIVQAKKAGVNVVPGRRRQDEHTTV